MKLPHAWMEQAESDFRTAQRVDNHVDPRTHCQAISKYQQCVEKSVKAVLDKLYAAGIVRNGSDRSHRVARYASTLKRLPTTKDSRNLLNQLQRIFSKRIVEAIVLLDSLVPEYPVNGTLAKRNHEYPFQQTITDWRAPAEATVFTDGEMKRVRTCAGMLVRRLRLILDALELLYPKYNNARPRNYQIHDSHRR